MIAAILLAAALPAFPGAEGFGAATPGGRGGKVIYVRTLADSGPGSLRAAVNTRGPRTIVFAVSGIIDLKSPIRVLEPFVTIAGQTAPGDGICLRGFGLLVDTHDAVIRFIRSRPGDIAGKEVDAVAVGGSSYNVVVDHCSATWCVDECLSASGAIRDVTVQWCLIGESLNKSVHGKGEHGYGSLVRAIGGVSLHHNLWVHNTARNPRLGDNYGKPPFPVFDVRNNVMYNWGAVCSGMTGDKLSANFVANYLRPGPDSNMRPPIALTKTADVAYFVEGNIVEGRPEVTGEAMFAPREENGRRLFSLQSTAFPAPLLAPTSADAALDQVISFAGAVLPRRDPVDERIAGHVRSRSGRIINSQKEVGGWPEYRSAAAAADADQDGMPDEWERSRRLNPNDPSDGKTDRDRDGYTNLEEYLNNLARKAFPAPAVRLN
jgi:pectate lyase